MAATKCAQFNYFLFPDSPDRLAKSDCKVSLVLAPECTFLVSSRLCSRHFDCCWHKGSIGIIAEKLASHNEIKLSKFVRTEERFSFRGQGLGEPSFCSKFERKRGARRTSSPLSPEGGRRVGEFKIIVIAIKLEINTRQSVRGREIFASMRPQKRHTENPRKHDQLADLTEIEVVFLCVCPDEPDDEDAHGYQKKSGEEQHWEACYVKMDQDYSSTEKQDQ